MIVADTSGLLALFNRREPAHARTAQALIASDEVLVVSPYVIAELDYLASTRLGIDAALSILHELVGGAYELPHLDASDIALCADVIERYRDQAIGVADASLVVLAQRFETRTILTLDRRHFALLRPLQRGHFRIIPE